MTGKRCLLARSTLALGAFLGLSACVTPAEEQQFRDDIFSLQSRLMQMESQLSSQGKEISTATNRQEASVGTRLDRIQMEIQRMKGEVDALKIGVTTGQLPGADADQQGSVAKSLSQLTERLSGVEDNQAKILAVIDKAGDGKKVEKKDGVKDKDQDKDKKSGEKKSNSLKTVTDLKAAFEKKKYKLIAEEGTKILSGIKAKKDKQEVTYILAESLFKNGDVREAALKYNEFIESKPKDNLSRALLRMGDCFKQLGDSETAKIYYQELIEKFSESEEARQAKSKLAKL